MKSDSFFEKVYQVTQLVPPGRVTSYGAIARFLGAAGSARMVGWALNHSHAQPDFIPAHRVVNRNGLLTGKQHFHGPDVMEALLQSEGIEVHNDQVMNFRELFWDPMENLRREDFD